MLAPLSSIKVPVPDVQMEDMANIICQNIYYYIQYYDYKIF